MPKPLSLDWREWLLLNKARGCDREVLFHKAAEQGFDLQDIVAVLDEPAGHAPALSCRDHRPRAWRLDTDQAEIYEIPSLLSRAECTAVIAAIDRALVPSTVTQGPEAFRTSRTCHLAQVEPMVTGELDQRFAALFGVDPALAEPLQGQRYDPGQYFKAHTDWFTPGTAEFEEHTRVGGQRTWTLMVYLNAVELGGETVFERVGRAFTPVPGLALAWNNLHADGSPNHATLHEAMPVERGRKYVITKWFRMERGRC